MQKSDDVLKKTVGEEEGVEGKTQRRSNVEVPAFLY